MEAVNRNGRMELHLKRARVELIGEQIADYDDVRVYENWVMMGNRIVTREQVRSVEDLGP